MRLGAGKVHLYLYNHKIIYLLRARSARHLADAVELGEGAALGNFFGRHRVGARLHCPRARTRTRTLSHSERKPAQPPPPRIPTRSAGLSDRARLRSDRARLCDLSRAAERRANPPPPQHTHLPVPLPPSLSILRPTTTRNSTGKAPQAGRNRRRRGRVRRRNGAGATTPQTQPETSPTTPGPRGRNDEATARAHTHTQTHTRGDRRHNARRTEYGENSNSHWGALIGVSPQPYANAPHNARARRRRVTGAARRPADLGGEVEHLVGDLGHPRHRRRQPCPLARRCKHTHTPTPPALPPRPPI